eukprot:tig00000523_g1844.t1
MHSPPSPQIFHGYGGDCVVAASSAPNATGGSSGVTDVEARWNGFEGRHTVASYKLASSRACNVSWVCESCRISASSNVTVSFLLASRNTLAALVSYRAAVPTDVSANGTIATSFSDRVFRGVVPVGLVVSSRGWDTGSPEDPFLLLLPGAPRALMIIPARRLTPVHFTDKKDGDPRYSASLQVADTEKAERTVMNFDPCLPDQPVCPKDRLAYTVYFELSDAYVLVNRKAKSSIVDFFSTLFSLGMLAFRVAGNLYIWYILLLKCCMKRGRTVPPLLMAGKKYEPKPASPGSSDGEDSDGSGSSAGALKPAPTLESGSGGKGRVLVPLGGTTPGGAAAAAARRRRAAPGAAGGAGPPQLRGRERGYLPGPVPPPGQGLAPGGAPAGPALPHPPASTGLARAAGPAPRPAKTPPLAPAPAPPRDPWHSGSAAHRPGPVSTAAHPLWIGPALWDIDPSAPAATPERPFPGSRASDVVHHSVSSLETPHRNRASASLPPAQSTPSGTPPVRRRPSNGSSVGESAQRGRGTARRGQPVPSDSSASDLARGGAVQAVQL